MPWGLKGFHESGQAHFVTFCCYRRRCLFVTAASRRTCESALERVRRSFGLSRLNHPTQANGRLEWATRRHLPGFLTICRRFVNKGGVMLTPSLRGGSIPVFSFFPKCFLTGKEIQGSFPSASLSGQASSAPQDDRGFRLASPYVSKRCEKSLLVRCCWRLRL